MSAQGDKFRNRPDEDPSTRRTAEDEIMRGKRKVGDRGVGQSGGGTAGGSGTGGGGVENEGTGSLLLEGEDADRVVQDDDQAEPDLDARDDAGSGSTKGGGAPGVSGKRGMTGGTEKQGEGHRGPIRSGSRDRGAAPSEQDRAAEGNENDNAREGYEDHGSSRDDEGTRGESSGSRPGYR